MHAKVINNTVVKYPFILDDLKDENPHTIFPANIDLVEIYSQTETGKNTGAILVLVEPRDKPSIDHAKQKAIEADPIIENAVWVQNWNIVPLTNEEMQTALSEKQLEVRGLRNTLLNESDWTQLLDSPINKQEWAVYRQALRDITSQPGFPFSVIWPNKP